MSMTTSYASAEPSRAEVDALPGATLLEFGAPWCGYCMAAQPLLSEAFAGHGNMREVRHIKIEDGKGRRLGRSYGVKLWPTLIFLNDGKEVARLVRPVDSQDIAQGLSAIDSAG
jgi:thioredoxin 1